MAAKVPPVLWNTVTQMFYSVWNHAYIVSELKMREISFYRLRDLHAIVVELFLK